MVHYHPNQPAEPVNVVWIGSLKNRNTSNYDADFSDHQKGQLVDHMRLLILSHKARAFRIGYLTDGYRIQFFKLWFDDIPQKTRSWWRGLAALFAEHRLCRNFRL